MTQKKQTFSSLNCRYDTTYGKRQTLNSGLDAPAPFILSKESLHYESGPLPDITECRYESVSGINGSSSWRGTDLPDRCLRDVPNKTVIFSRFVRRRCIFCIYLNGQMIGRRGEGAAACAVWTELKKTKDWSENIRPLNTETSPESAKYETGIVTTTPRRSVLG